MTFAQWQGKEENVKEENGVVFTFAMAMEKGLGMTMEFHFPIVRQNKEFHSGAMKQMSLV